MKFAMYLSLLLISLNTQAQNCKKCKDSSIVINPFGKDIIYSVCRELGTTIKFKITNVNPFKLEGITSAIRQSIDFDVPTQFSSIPKATETDKDTLKKADEKKTNKLAMIAFENNRDVKNDFIVNYNAFIQALNRLALFNSIQDYIDSNLQETYISDPDLLKSNLKSYITSINDNDPNAELIRAKTKMALNDLTDSYIKAKKAYEELAKSVTNDTVKITGTLANKDESVKIKLDDVSVSLKLKKYFEEEFQFIKKKFDIINSEKKRTEIINKSNAGIDFYNKVQKSNFEIHTDAHQVDDDIIILTPKLKNKKGEIIKEYNPVEVKAYGGVKVNFSTGYLLSFKGNENYRNLYDTSGIIGVQKNKTDDLTHALGALVHVYQRNCNSVNFGFTAGLSIPTDGVRIGFYTGVSALMLEKHRLVITAGASFIKTKILNTSNLTRANNRTEESYIFSNKDYKEIVYDELYKPAFFVGITYNLSQAKKTN